MIWFSHSEFIKKYEKFIKIGKELNFFVQIPQFPRVDLLFIQKEKVPSRSNDLKIAIRERGTFLLYKRKFFSFSNCNEMDLIADIMNPNINNSDEAVSKSIQAKYGLNEVLDNWLHQESEERNKKYKELGWHLLTSSKYIEIWNLVCEKFNLEGESLNIPSPKEKWDISEIFSSDEKTSEELEMDFLIKMLDSFKKILSPNEYLYVLDYDNSIWKFYPHEGVKDPYRCHWVFSILSRNEQVYTAKTDPVYFLSHNFEFGTMGLWKENSIWIFGKDLLNTIKQNPPKLFQNMA